MYDIWKDIKVYFDCLRYEEEHPGSIPITLLMNSKKAKEFILWMSKEFIKEQEKRIKLHNQMTDALKNYKQRLEG